MLIYIKKLLQSTGVESKTESLYVHAVEFLYFAIKKWEMIFNSLR